MLRHLPFHIVADWLVGDDAIIAVPEVILLIIVLAAKEEEGPACREDSLMSINRLHLVGVDLS